MVDFAPRDGFSVVEAAKLHATLTFAGSLAHQPRIKSRITPTSAAEAEASGSSGASIVPRGISPAGAAAASFNHDACMAMPEGLLR